METTETAEVDWSWLDQPILSKYDWAEQASKASGIPGAAWAATYYLEWVDSLPVTTERG